MTYLGRHIYDIIVMTSSGPKRLFGESQATLRNPPGDFIQYIDVFTYFNLRLHGNPVGDKGIAFIVDAILENKDTVLSTLDIGDCGLTDDGAILVSRLLVSNNTIADLNISANQITHRGWREISEALKKTSKLRTLSLDYNKITDEDVAVIADGLRHNTTLRSIDLDSNHIRDEGGRVLLDVVKGNERLIDVTLMPMNQISEGILTDIKEILDNRIRPRPSSANSDGVTT